jgi:hypothetical protein
MNLHALILGRKFGCSIGWIDDCAKCEYPIDWGLTIFVLVPRCHIPNFNELFQRLTLKVSNVVRDLPKIY